MGRLIRSAAWHETELGDPVSWPRELWTCLNLMMASTQPMFVGWGPDMIGFYNDAYRQVLGHDKHPAALGQPLATTFGEDAYPVLQPVFEALLEEGRAFAQGGAAIPLNRNGYLEECFFDFAYTPIYTEHGTVGGLFVTCTEVTDREIGQRRTSLLASLSAQIMGVQTREDVAQVVCQTLEHHPHDIPVALMYLPETGAAAAPETGQETAPAGQQSFRLHAATHTPAVLAAGAPEVLHAPAQLHEVGLLHEVPPYPSSVWPEPVTQVAVLPLLHPDGQTALGLLIVGLNPRKRFDDSYHAFLGLLRHQTTSALIRAHAFALERWHTEQARQQAELLARQNAQLEARARALQGFSDLTRDLNVAADPPALAQRALEGLMALLPAGYATYFELEGSCWQERARAGEYGHPELAAAVVAGLPYETTANLRIPWETGHPFYQDSYDQATDGLTVSTAHVKATACLPVTASGHRLGVIGCGLFDGRAWTPEDHAVAEAIVQSLGLAIEGAQRAADLRERTAELMRSNAELERFAAVASHDLQEPLRTVTSFSDLLIQRHSDSLNDNALKYLGFIQRGGRQMKALVDDLLTFSRLGDGQQARRLVPVGRVYQEALQRLEGAVQEAGAELEADDLPEVLGDEARLTQLFQNLLGNAIKFRRPGVPPRIQLQACRDWDVWHFCLQDNGIGMDAQHLGQVFEMFKRLHTRDEYQGSGLGLSICKKIVEDHGGRIWVESHSGQGSTFHFTLPVAAG